MVLAGTFRAEPCEFDALGGRGALRRVGVLVAPRDPVPPELLDGVALRAGALCVLPRLGLAERCEPRGLPRFVLGDDRRGCGAAFLRVGVAREPLDRRELPLRAREEPDDDRDGRLAPRELPRRDGRLAFGRDPDDFLPDCDAFRVFGDPAQVSPAGRLKTTVNASIGTRARSLVMRLMGNPRLAL